MNLFSVVQVNGGEEVFLLLDISVVDSFERCWRKPYTISVAKIYLGVVCIIKGNMNRRERCFRRVALVDFTRLTTVR